MKNADSKAIIRRSVKHADKKIKGHTSTVTILVKPKPVTMKFKPTVTVIMFCLLAVSLMAQEEQGHRRVYDIGLRFSSLNSFGISYKMGNLQNHFRVTGLVLDLSTATADGITYDTVSGSSKGGVVGFGLRTGYERVIPLVKNLHLSLGADAGISYYNHKSEGDLYDDYTEKDYVLGIYPVIGVGYKAGEHFVITAELSPGFYYHYSKSTGNAMYFSEVVTKEWGLDLSTGSASITVAYRISKIVLFKDK